MVRENSAFLQSSPYFSYVTPPKGNPWAILSFPNVRTFQQIVQSHAQTPNEQNWTTNSDWIGLGPQSVENFHLTGVADKPLEYVKSAIAKLPHIQSKFGRPRPAVCGSQWDIPAVLANLPLSARTRTRTKLTPLNIRLACFFSGAISAESLAPLTAKLVRAIYDYTMAGGVVNLRVGFVSSIKLPRANQALIEAHVNTSDLASLATILSPVGYRALGGRLNSALCQSAKNTGAGFETDHSLPDTYWLSGRLEDVFKASEKVFTQLRII